MEPQVSDTLLTQPIDSPNPPKSKSAVLKDPSDISELKKAISFIASQSSSTFHEQFNRTHVMSIHNSAITSLSITPDQRYAVTCSTDTVINVINLQAKQLEARFQGHRLKVNSVSISENGQLIASGSDDKTVKVWTMRMRKEEACFTEHKWPVKSVAISPDAKYVISAAEDKMILVWNLQNKKIEHKFLYGTVTISISFTSDSRYFAAADQVGEIRVHNVFARRWELSLKGHKDAILAICYSPDCKFLASGSVDHKIIVWDIAKAAQEFELNGHENEVFSVNFSKDSNFLVSGSKDLTVRVWSMSLQKEIHRLDGHSDVVTGVAFTSASHLSILSCSSDLNIVFWDLTTKCRVKELEGHPTLVTSLSLTNDGKYLMTSSGDISYASSGELIIWNTEDFTEIFRNKCHEQGMICSALSSDNKIFATGSNDRTVKIYDFSSKEEIKILEGHTTEVNSISFSPNGLWLASASGSRNHHRRGEIIIWNLAGFSQEKTITKENQRNPYFHFVSFFPDSLYIAAATFCSVTVWNLMTFEVYFEFNNHRSIVQVFKVTPDGKYIVSGDMDQFVKVWNFREKRLDFSYKNSKFGINSLSVSPDSQYVIAGSYDRSFTIWNIKEKLIEFYFNQDTIPRSLLFCRSVKSFFVGTEDKKIQIWNLSNVPALTKLYGQSLDTWEVVFTESYETAIRNKTSFELKTVKNKPLEGSVLPVGVLEPFSVFDESLYEFNIYHNAVISIIYDNYSNMLPGAWKVLISNLKFTPLHFATHKGHTKVIEDLISLNKLYFRADRLGRSPIYYSIQAKHQTITDKYLDYLINLASGSDFSVFYPVFYSTRNDLPNIIINASPNLCDFLDKCIYSKEEPPYFGVPNTNVQFISSVSTSYSDFVSDQTENSEPLKFITSLYELPAAIGSNASKELLESFLRCSNKDLFGSVLVNRFIRSRWDALRPWIYFYTVLLWTNIALLIILIDYNLSDNENKGSVYYLVSICLFIVVNVLLLVWEMMQCYTTGLSYIKEGWNIMDISRVTITTVWIVLQNYLSRNDDFFTAVQWLTVVLNLIRGVTGFQAFDMTRYYVGLIINSVFNVSSFLFIFVYMVIAFGLLNLSTRGKSVNFDSLWIGSFSLGMGDAEAFEYDKENLSLNYITYLTAVILNVILMLNMIISILGDSFDEFQLFSVYYDNKGMTQVIVEIEEIFSMFSPESLSKYLHVCVNAYASSDSTWEGKILCLQNCIKGQVSLVSDKIDKSSLDLNKSLITVVESFNTQQKKNEADFKALNEQVRNLEKSVSGINEVLLAKMSGIDSALSSLSSKLETLSNPIS